MLESSFSCEKACICTMLFGSLSHTFTHKVGHHHHHHIKCLIKTGTHTHTHAVLSGMTSPVWQVRCSLFYHACRHFLHMLNVGEKRALGKRRKFNLLSRAANFTCKVGVGSRQYQRIWKFPLLSKASFSAVSPAL